MPSNWRFHVYQIKIIYAQRFASAAVPYPSINAHDKILLV